MVAALIVAIIVLVLVLPRHKTVTTTPTNATLNLTSPGNITRPTESTTAISTSTIVQSGTKNSTTSSTTTSLPTTTTTTIGYAYCVGSPVPSFSQTYYAALYANGTGPWHPTTDYPLPLLGGSCNIYHGYIYCVNNMFKKIQQESFFANVSAAGASKWQRTTNYPTPGIGTSCTIYNGYIYCVGNENSTYSKYTSYAPVSQYGIGVWKNTTSFPVPFYDGSCNAYNGYIYCVGDEYFNPVPSSNSISYNALSTIAPSPYYAPISSAGIGAWKSTTPPPIPMSGAACTIDSGTIYCTGGNSKIYSLINTLNNQIKSIASLNSTIVSIIYGDLANFNATLNNTIINNPALNGSATFYAGVSADGIGAWKNTTPYPIQLTQASCFSNSHTVYCVGTSGSNNAQSVFYADAGPNGLSQWNPTTSYPVQFYRNSCSALD